MFMDESGWEAFSRGSPVRRAGRAGFRRNVAVALGNWGDEAAVPALSSGVVDPDPIVRSHSVWALGQVNAESARVALSQGLAGESDSSVRAEIEAALWPSGTSSGS